jgi:MFS family permease
MKPRVGVYLSEPTAARLTAAAQGPGATKSALVEAALDRYLSSDDDVCDTATVARCLAAMGRQLEKLERDLRTVNETVALHARFQLATTPPMPDAALRRACALGVERFEEFAAQVGRRIDLGTPLIQETIERIAAKKPTGLEGDTLDACPSGAMPTGDEPGFGPAIDVSEHIAAVREDAATLGLRAVEAALFPDSAICRGIDEGKVAVPSRPSVPIWLTAPRQEAKGPVEKRSPILRVFLPFAAGCYLAFLFRTINALVAAPLALEFGLGAGDLGLLTSVYFLVFAAAQIPVGIVLDRDGPRRIQSALLLVIAAGSALFAFSDNFWGLLGGRALMGLGVAAALTAGLQALMLWFPRDRVPLLNGLMIMLGGLGAVTATIPAELLLPSVGWRGLFNLLAALAAVCAILIYVVVPKAAPAKPVKKEPTLLSLRRIYSDPGFWRLAPLSATSVGTAWALHGLWAAQWFGDVERLDRAALVQHLFAMAVALSVGALALGVVIDRLRRRGISPETLLSMVTVVFIAAQLALILRWPLPSYIPWAIIAAVGAATVLSFAVLAEIFPRDLAGRANGALNVFHIGGAFVLQYATGVVLQHWMPEAGHYPEIAYQTAFALNVILQIAAWVWFMMPRASLRTPVVWQQRSS